MITNFQPIPGFDHGAQWIERRAKLFEAGEYPDKGVTIDRAQLAQIAARFVDPVPVLIEHADSPLELGYLVSVETADGELFGQISLTKEADALVERSGAKSLSIGLSPDLSEIREVSLVRSPRVADARLFSCGGLCDPTPNPLLTPLGRKEAHSEESWKAKFQALEAQTRAADAERTVNRYVAEGRLLPAESEFAKALLQATAGIEFDGGSTPVAQIFTAMIEQRSPHRLLGEIAPGPETGIPTTMMPEEAEFYRKHFPDVGLDVIAGCRRGGAA